jgi:hypothetical protein
LSKQQTALAEAFTKPTTVGDGRIGGIASLNMVPWMRLGASPATSRRKPNLQRTLQAGASFSTGR